MPLSHWTPGVDAQGRELAKHGNAAFPIGCYYDSLSVEPVVWHWHDEMECAFVTEGECTFLIGSERILLKTGEGIFIIPGIVHAVADPMIDSTMTEPPDCRLHSMCFHPRLVGGSPESVFWQNYVQPLNTDMANIYVHLDPNVYWQREALDALENAWQTCIADEPGFELEVRNYLSRLVWLLTANKSSQQARPSEKSLRDAERIKTMLQYIHEHYSEELDTASIAQSALISASECLRCFHNTIGTTPIQYVKQYRVQQAARLLLTTELKIIDIGTMCGFQEMSYFAKTFREIMGCTPKEFRKREQEQNT